jgi:DNA-binding GntR family transcriptional regulator
MNQTKLSAGVLPKYRQLLQLLRTQILSGELVPGARLPTEDELIRRYALARGTVRRAVEQLAAEGLIVTTQGSGSYVSARHPSAVPFRFASADEPDSTFRVLTREIIPAGLTVAERLALPLGEPLIHIARQRLARGSVVAYSERYLPRSLCPDLLDQDLTVQSIHGVLVARSELPLLRAVLEIEAQLLDEADAAALEAPVHSPAIVVTRLTYTAPHRPAVFYRGLHRQRYDLGVSVDALPDPGKELK